MKVSPGSVFPINDVWKFSYFIDGIRVESSYVYDRAGEAKRDMLKLVDKLNDDYWED